MSRPPWTLASLLELAWSRIEAGVDDPRAASRNLTLATIGPAGPEARTLVVRGADRAAGTLDAHADAASAKVAQLRADPRATMHVWDAEAAIQVCVRGRMEVVTGPGADEAWARVPEEARSNYGGEPGPGRPIASPLAHGLGADRERFAILRLRAQEVEALLLGERHLRAVYRRDDEFAGGWVAP